MAGSLNKVMLIGNLGRDPESKTTASGSKIVNLTVATSESWKDRQTGEKQERTEWHRVVIYNQNLADIAEKYLRKGTKVYIEGSLQTRKWTDSSGIEKYTTEVVLNAFKGEMTILDNKSVSNGFAGNTSETSSSDTSASWDSYKESSSSSDPDDKIPF